MYKSFATPKASGKTRRKVGADVSYAASVSGNPALGAAAVVQAADEAAETLAPVESDGLVHALSDINIDIADGDVFGIIGMSGAGKSTLVRTINLLERPTSGTIEVDGRDVTLSLIHICCSIMCTTRAIDAGPPIGRLAVDERSLRGSRRDPPQRGA